MVGEELEKKTGCYLKHQRDLKNPGELIQATNEFGCRFSFCRRHCVYCGAWIGDEIIKEE